MELSKTIIKDALENLDALKLPGLPGGLSDYPPAAPDKLDEAEATQEETDEAPADSGISNGAVHSK